MSQDLFYRINVIELIVPPLRDREGDIELLIYHFLEKTSKNMQISTPSLSKEVLSHLKSYYFEGNVRELENILQRAVTLCEDDSIRIEDLSLSQKAQASSNQNLVDANMSNELFMIKAALEKHKWNKKTAAEDLGLSYRQLRYKVEKLGLD